MFNSCYLLYTLTKATTEKRFSTIMKLERDLIIFTVPVFFWEVYECVSTT